MKKLFDQDAADFMPDALAVRHARLPMWARGGIWFMLLCFVIALVWASLGKVDVIVSARGKLVSDHPTIVMKPLERTVIKAVHVAVGDRVKAGQVLATFDPVFSESDKDRLAAEIRQYQALFDRLSAEFEKREYNLAPNADDEARWQHSIFLKRKRFYAERMEFFRNELEKLTNARAALKDTIAVQHRRLKGYRDIEDIYARLLKTQSASPRMFKEAQLNRLAMEADVNERESNFRTLGSEIAARQAEREAFDQQWKIAVAEEMVKARENLTRSKKEYDKALQMTSYVDLKAPEDAVVHDIAPLSIGSAVREAETLVTLVPLGGTLEVEAQVRADDIGRVKPGDSVRVKITAFPFQKHGTLEGQVRFLSEDAFSSSGSEKGPDRPENAFYRARIALDAEKNRDSVLLPRLIPGMETECEIRVGERRIIEYLTHPIIKSLDESIKEP